MKVRLRMSFDSKIDVNTKQDNLLNNTANTNHITFLCTVTDTKSDIQICVAVGLQRAKQIRFQGAHTLNLSTYLYHVYIHTTFFFVALFATYRQVLTMQCAKAKDSLARSLFSSYYLVFIYCLYLRHRYYTYGYSLKSFHINKSI